jgi:hypothetical protein
MVLHDVIEHHPAQQADGQAPDVQASGEEWPAHGWLDEQSGPRARLSPATASD